MTGPRNEEEVVGNKSRPCARCSGRGALICDTCEGSGSMVGNPVVWSLLSEDSVAYTMGGDEMPDEVALSLVDIDVSNAEVEHEQEGAYISGLEGHPESQANQGYRDPAFETPLGMAVRKLLQDPPVPAKADMVRQKLTIMGVPAWRVRTKETDDVWVYGAPPAVYPPEAMRKGGFAGLFAMLFGT